MKKQWQSLFLLCTTWLALAAPASAMPVVATGTSYSVYFDRAGNNAPAFALFTFDGNQEETPFDNGILRVSEREDVINDTSSLITISISSTTDFLPAGDDVLLLGIGTGGFALNLSFPVRLVDARISFFQPAPTPILIDTTGNLASEAGERDPWNGIFPTPDTLLEISEIGGRNVQEISIEFLVSTQAEVPEPGSVLLGGMGLLALVAIRRRKPGTHRR